MDDDLPTDFQVIVVGTGMVESIVAAACSRIGKNVLHLDSSDHYGGLWASYNFDGLQKFIKEVNSDPNRQQQVYNLSEKWYIEKDSPQEEKNAEGEEKTEDSQAEPPKKVWSQANFTSEYRKFNIDMTPKLLFSRGPLVELLISSNIARYAEFRCVTRVLTWLNDRLMPVPCSRADVFATEAVGIVEKRMLMKMLTSIVGYNEEEMNNEFKDWNDKTFKEYLTHKGLTPNLIHYVLYAIAGGTDKMPCLEGVKECKKFLMSLGRYGNTPFLWPMYGSGELPQCFCRLCAVFGGVYCLNRPIDKVETKMVDEGKTVVSIESKSKTLNCDHLVIGINECPKELLAPEPAESCDISKAIFITNGTILPSEKEPLSLLRFPPLSEKDNAVTVLEVGAATGSCPKGLFVVYFITNKVTDAESDLRPYAEKIFDMSGGDQTSISDKPKCLWSLFYNAADGGGVSSAAASDAGGVYVCAGPDAGLDFDRAVLQAEEIFKKICPGEEFLPRAPDPEEIVFEDDVTHGPEFRREDEDADGDAAKE
ncbi:rab proteins geranylgeranyltransferase component A 2 [Achroia grisella]|uniref:rab proteins geranylgeranyltransferase component A 2 n=1 Tax=Achroia grisella TaxID=688607 RepID=UPI0027D2AE9A|nr:rab proteins geranylgeranyltransferase component A 2 [Achroia grisella]